jgi:hypothetical protein
VVRVPVPVARFRFAIGLCPRLLRLRWCPTHPAACTVPFRHGRTSTARSVVGPNRSPVLKIHAGPWGLGRRTLDQRTPDQQTRTQQTRTQQTLDPRDLPADGSACFPAAEPGFASLPTLTLFG